MSNNSANELLSMDLHETVETVQNALRSVGAEVASPWFYLQFGLILAAAGIAWAADAAIRSRVDMSSLAMRWPMPLRHFVRVMVLSASTAIFAIEMIASRVIMSHATWPSRSYLIVVSAKLALAWLAIRLITSVIRNHFCKSESTGMTGSSLAARRRGLYRWHFHTGIRWWKYHSYPPLAPSAGEADRLIARRVGSACPSYVVLKADVVRNALEG